MGTDRFRQAVERIRNHTGIVTAVWGPGAHYPGLSGRPIRTGELIVAFEPDQAAHQEFLSEQRRLPPDHPAKTNVISFSKKAQDVSIPAPFADEIHMMNVIKLAKGMGPAEVLQIAKAHLKPGRQSHILIGQTYMPLELPGEQLERIAEQNGFDVDFLVKGAEDSTARQIANNLLEIGRAARINVGNLAWDQLHEHQVKQGIPGNDRKIITDIMGPHAADYVLPEYYIAKLTRKNEAH